MFWDYQYWKPRMHILLNVLNASIHMIVTKSDQGPPIATPPSDFGVKIKVLRVAIFLG